MTELPSWPLALLFAGYPVFWLLGLGALAAPIAGTVMLAHLLLLRPAARVPRGFGFWLLFLLWTLVAATQLDTTGRIIGFGFRFLNFSSATVIFVYIYNSTRERLPSRRVVGLMVVFFLWVVAGGLLGVLMPDGSLSTPFEKVLPGSVMANEYVRDLVHPTFAEVSWPWEAPSPYQRPRAPFAYTNNWGGHFALLIPYVLLMMTWVRRFWSKVLLAGLLAISLVPAFATLNRGMFLAVLVGVVYTAMRFFLRGHVRWPTAIFGLLAVGLIASLLAGLGQNINSRVENSETNTGRVGIYTETFNRTLKAPILGYGGPRPSQTLVVAAGSQGQFWNVMFSYGFPGLALYCLWLWSLAWRTRSPADPLLWMHAVLVMASFMLFYYGFDQTELVACFVAAALIMRAAGDPRRPAPRPRPSVPGAPP